jgi:hypothetical protein
MLLRRLTDRHDIEGVFQQPARKTCDKSGLVGRAFVTRPGLSVAVMRGRAPSRSAFITLILEVIY